jgi:hypothetical protein
MIDEATLAQMNGEYIMPPDAGPAWRAAFAFGIDMSLIEENLQRSPWERLLANERALALIRALEQGKPVADGTTHLTL